MIDTLKPLIKQFLPFAQERMGFGHPPRLFLRQDSNNAANPLGKTAYYDPEASSVTLYVTDRHPKDVMRSLSHELVHHTQHCNGEFNNVGEMGEGYAQNNPHLREMERQAYEVGNLCFRDWEDSIKGTIYSECLQKGVKGSMSTKNWKNKELNSLLLEKWGFKFNLLQENDGKVFTPNHYCAHHVREDASGKEGNCVDHNWNEKLQEVTAYDVDFGDGDVRTLSVNDLTILEASLPEGHEGHMAKRDDEEEEIEEGAKPDFLDLDKDGDKEEPMKSAAKDKDLNEEEEEIEERRGRSRKGPSTRTDDPRLRESELRELVREALKIVMERKNNG